MLEIREFQQVLLKHELTPAGPIPTVYDPDGVYPYSSFTETSRRPVLKAFRFIALENDLLKVTVCPDLGGKVHSILDKRTNQEVLFVPESICPVRILPRLGFAPGGIQVSFPISHSPVQLESIDFEASRVGDRVYLWCGERELHFGLQWTVEFSLGPKDPFLTQRALFRNPGTSPYPWMSWSNAAVPARPDTEFHFPNGPVLYHGADLKNIDWATEGPHRVKDLARMAGFFWRNPDGCAFGAFTPSLGQGLYHIADPKMAPGIKLWTYGLGPHEAWGQAGSVSGETYLEIQGGPIRDQSIKEWLQPGELRSHTEFWRPSETPLALPRIPLPAPALVPASRVPAFDWTLRPEVQFWLSLAQAYRARSVTSVPPPPGLESNWWAPSGMEHLGDALRWAAATSTGKERDRWLFQLGAWLSARELVPEALEVLEGSGDDRARALTGRLQGRARGNPRASVEAFRGIAAVSLALHPQVVVERDEALAALGSETLEERARWLARVSHAQDEWLLERRAALLLDQGKAREAEALLSAVSFQLVHQRYTRTALWQRCQQMLHSPMATVPPGLGEDDLARFGAYREYEP